ncbi:ATP-binding protein [Microbacterium sp. ARD31]|uniref:ATP-binding protein n=1 Tax=Microbacterium sp. ARD31 TaxID=2962576 RepID=UPI00288274AB|nr:ATP-binding protein [Microbacterium sp. ARD31]MDT0184483.1 ATP-binding protein [Microbacterium sp. ARD31]
MTAAGSGADTVTDTGEDRKPGVGSERAPDAEVRRELTVAELAVVRARLRGSDPAPAESALASLRRHADQPSPLDALAAGLGLSDFEGATLLLACGPDLVGEVARELVEHGGAPRLTFATALEKLPGAHWDALTHRGPLRRWQLVRLAEPTAVLTSPLVPDERVVHHLVGVDTLDEQLELASQQLDVPARLPWTYAEVVGDVVSRWRATGPVVLRGTQPRTTCALAAAACAAVGLRPRVLGVSALAEGAGELTSTLQRLVRETVLGRVAWVLDVEEAPARSVADLGRALAGAEAPILVVGSSRPGSAPLDALGLAVVEVPRLGVGERRTTLAAALEGAGVPVTDDEVDAAAGAFDLALPDADAVAAEVGTGVDLWEACRRRPRADVGALARVRTARAVWDELVLPERQLEQLRALAATVRQRARVLDDWGFADRSDRGRGTTALFAGDSGTGKTFAAEVIAHDLALDLVHVDLSQVVDKYLGETEKRLARLFDAAEDGGMVLLFDEADALFGKRSEVKDSHDRYANVEVGYLLQRLEAFGGLAILTTNARSALDPAFTRRLAMIVDFPYPDRAVRERMWDLSLPQPMPRADVSPARLADADLSGGAIAAAALQAAYLAAADGGVVTMDHLERAVRWELAKTGRVAPLDGTRQARTVR